MELEPVYLSDSLTSSLWGHRDENKKPSMLCKELELASRAAGSFRVAEWHGLEPLWFMTLFCPKWTSQNRTSQVAQVVKTPPANAGDTRDKGLIPGSGRSPGGGNGTPSSILVWRMPWTEEPGRLQSMQLQRVRHIWVTNTHALLVRIYHKVVIVNALWLPR